MLIVTSGCSHSVIFPEKENIIAANPHLQSVDEWTYDVDVPNPWPNQLAASLKADLVNLSSEGKDNNQIFNDTLSYLSDPLKPKPDFLVVQWTELRRLNIFKSRHSESWDKFLLGDRPNNNLFSPIQWKKIAVHPKLPEWRTILQKTETGNIAPVELFHNSNRVEILDVIHKTFALQAVCDLQNVKLCILNMHGLNDMPEHVYKRINHESFLIRNVWSSVGWFDHLYWEGFTPAWHNHFKDDAHSYTAECLKDFFETGKRIYTEVVSYPEGDRVYRYTTDE